MPKPNEYVKIALTIIRYNQSTPTVSYYNGETQMEMRACAYV